MNPVTHFLTGWSVANAAPFSRKELALVSIAGVIPDLDGLGMVPDWLTRNSAQPLNWWGKYHHLLGHNAGFALAVVGGTFALSRKRWLAAAMAFLSFHLHLLGDIVGARGPDGDQWPIPYLLPFSNVWQLSWQGQWELNAWPNFLITRLLLLLTFYLAWKRGYSLLEMFSLSADRVFVAALRTRFGFPQRNP